MILKNTSQYKWFLLYVFLFIFNQASFAEQPLAKKNEFYTEDSLNIIVTKNSPQFTLKLKSNPTTGYAWFLRDYSKILIKPLKHRYEKSSNQLMGAPGYEFWTFRVNPAGFVVPQNTTIRMIYARPWQGIDNSKQLIFRVSTISVANHF